MAGKGWGGASMAPKPAPQAAPGPARAILGRPLGVIGYNLVGQIVVGENKPQATTLDIQDRCLYVRSMALEDGGVLHVIRHDGSHLWVREWAVAE